MSIFGSTVTAIHVLGLANVSTDTYTFSNANAGTAIIIDSGAVAANGVANAAVDATGASVTYSTADSSGATDSVSVTLSQGAGGLYGTPAVNTVAALSLTDSVSVGIGNVTIVSNNNGFNSSNVITALTDPNLSTLTVNGTGGLTIINSCNVTESHKQ